MGRWRGIGIIGEVGFLGTVALKFVVFRLLTCAGILVWGLRTVSGWKGRGAGSGSGSGAGIVEGAVRLSTGIEMAGMEMAGTAASGDREDVAMGM